MCEVWIKLPLYYRSLICVARVVRRPRQHLAVLCKSDEFRAAGSSWLGSAEIMYGGQRFRHRYFSKAAILWLQYNTMRWKRSDSFLQRENHSMIGASSKRATYKMTINGNVASIPIGALLPESFNNVIVASRKYQCKL